jgi:hypothetical protein
VPKISTAQNQSAKDGHFFGVFIGLPGGTARLILLRTFLMSDKDSFHEASLSDADEHARLDADARPHDGADDMSHDMHHDGQGHDVHDEARQGRQHGHDERRVRDDEQHDEERHALHDDVLRNADDDVLRDAHVS